MLFVNRLLMKFLSIFNENWTSLSINCIITHQKISLFNILFRHGVKKFDQKDLIFLLSTAFNLKITFTEYITLC